MLHSVSHNTIEYHKWYTFSCCFLFRSTHYSSRPAKRLWHYLVNCDYLQDVFIHYVFRKRKTLSEVSRSSAFHKLLMLSSSSWKESRLALSIFEVLQDLFFKTANWQTDVGEMVFKFLSWCTRLGYPLPSSSSYLVLSLYVMDSSTNVLKVLGCATV